MITSSNKYEEYIEKVKSNIENIKEEREKARYDSLIAEATNKYNEAESEFNKKKQSGEEKIQDAENKISKGKEEIETGRKTLNNNKAKADSEFAKAKQQIQNAKNEISVNEQTLNAKKEEAQTSIAQAQSEKKNLQTQLTNVQNTLNTLQEQYSQINIALSNPQLTESEKNVLLEQKENIKIGIDTANTSVIQLQTGITKIDEEVSKANKELQDAQTKINNAKTEISEQEKNLSEKIQATYAQINQGLTKLEISEKEISEAETELINSKTEFNNKIKEAEGKLIDAKQAIAEIENPTWYILGRNSNQGYRGFIQDTESIGNIGKVFPIVFFVVATLISLTSMTRMVDEERLQIGTLKALGYNKLQIASKYIIYATLACIIGGVLGMSLGFVLLPKIIWMMYKMMYVMPEIQIEFNIYYGTLGLGIASICIVGATIYSVTKSLRNLPAVLMRPKAPKMGKRVILERIPFIWKILSFSKKVTVRNIFRYKKRFFMTIIGICGCTALITAGFGIRDSIRVILPNQYGNIFNYDMQVSIKSSVEEQNKQNLINELSLKDTTEQICEVYYTSGNLINDDKKEDVQIIVPKDNTTIYDMISMKDIQTKENIDLSNCEICITDKVAQLLNVKKGDNIILKNNDIEKEVTISNILENYVYHYVYMPKNVYESLYGNYDTNMLLINNKQMSEEQEKELSKEIMTKTEVGGVSLTSSVMGMLDDTMKSLNYVVVILIVSAGLLAFVVLYNLANVNISERIRELATIKVLGFYDKEVYSYVTRETVILTIIGIMLGMVGGYFLSSFVMGTCEINILRFSKIVKPMSYVYSILITIIFTVIVNIATYFSLKKIDMIESLKSVE